MTVIQREISCFVRRVEFDYLLFSENTHSAMSRAGETKFSGSDDINEVGVSKFLSGEFKLSNLTLSHTH